MDSQVISVEANVTNLNGKPLVIGVAGPTCGGKTTTVVDIIRELKDFEETSGEQQKNVICVSSDNFYRGGDSTTNYDVPESIDEPLLRECIEQLIEGKSVNIPIYDFKTHSRTDKTQKIGPAKIIIVEGILIFAMKSIRDLCNLRIFVEADNVICYTRRLKRDVVERGRTFEEVEERYLKHVVPSYNEYVGPSKFHAHIILVNNENGQFVGLEILLDHIRKRITQIQ